MVILIFVSNLIYLSCRIINYKRDVEFVNKFVLALSNKEMIKINVVDIEKFYDFVVKNFLIWIHLCLQNSIWNFLCRVFYFWHSAKKVIAECQKKNTRQRIFKFKKFKCSFAWQDDFKTKSYQLHSFITFWDIQSLFREFFHPRLFKKIQI
jgi:hypothetical protein